MNRTERIFFICIVGVVSVAFGFGAAYMKMHFQTVTGSKTVADHIPSYGPRDVFDSALVSSRRVSSTSEVRGVIVNHHLLAANFIADTLRRVDWRSVDRVILISPNHFLAGYGFTISSQANWQTPYGTVRVDRQALQCLESKGVIHFNDAVLGHEHGVYNILPFLAKIKPNIVVVPLVIRDGMSQEKIDELRHGLEKLMDDRTIVVGSFDFSHYKTSDVADSHDAVAIEVVQRFDTEATAGLDIDSPPGIHLVLDLMHDAGAEVFTLVHHSNSAKIIGNLSLAETTSYVTGTFATRHPLGYTASVLIHR